MEHNTMKIVAKTGFLLQSEVVTAAELKKAEDPMTKAVRLVSCNFGFLAAW